MFKEPFLKFAYNLTWNPLENWVISIFSQQKAFTRKFKEYCIIFYIFQGLQM